MFTILEIMYFILFIYVLLELSIYLQQFLIQYAA